MTGAGEEGDGGVKLAFGDWDSASGRSAVINGDIYAAIESDTVRSRAIVDGEDEWANASLYLVSGALLNDQSLEPCQNCDFMNWGTWGGQIEFKDGYHDVTADFNLGWYIVGEISTLDDLAGITGTATYDGSAIGNVAALSNGIWNTYVATGDAHMDWDFGQRAGMLEITNFDESGPYGPLNVSGRMDMPGVLAGNAEWNKFGGPLDGSLGTGQSALGIAGAANGSFVKNGSDVVGGAIGNWNVGNSVYKATGVFGMGKTGTGGPVNLPSPN